MSISPVAGPGGSYSFKTSAPQQVSDAPLFAPHDPLNQYLTNEDRARLKAATSLDLRADGDIVSPESMQPNEYFAALQLAHRVAADRASGSITGDLSSQYMTKMFHQFHFHEVAGASAGAVDSSKDLTAEYLAKIFKEYSFSDPADDETASSPSADHRV